MRKVIGVLLVGVGIAGLAVYAAKKYGPQIGKLAMDASTKVTAKVNELHTKVNKMFTKDAGSVADAEVVPAAGEENKTKTVDNV